MDEIETIREKLKNNASDSEEEERLLSLFDRTCEELSRKDSKSILNEIDEHLRSFLDAFNRKAAKVEQIVKGRGSK